jgi:8-oxo-dGTP pyrophosphatase MutT (NUDIX family)
MQADFKYITQRISSHVSARLYDPALRRACVFVPFVMHHNALHLLLTKRTDRVEHHKGQISFPGGMVDETDLSPEHTALRELEEELGIKPSSVSLIGQLDDIQIPTGFIVTPVVGFIHTLNSIKTSHDEVEEILFIPFENFLNPALRRIETRELLGKRRQVYYYDVWKEPVWGATAHIIKQLTDLLEQ